MRSCRFGVRISVVLFVLTLSTDVAQGATAYWRITTDRMSIVSDASAKRCERLATQFTRLEQLMAELSNWDSDFEPTPLAIFSVSKADSRRYFLSTDERRRESQQGMRIYSKFLPGRDLNMAAIVNVGTEEPLQSALLLYAQSLMTVGPTRRYPGWFQIGVSNLLNGLVIRDDGSVLLNRDVLFEATIDNNTDQIRTLSLGRLLAITPTEINPSNIRAYSLRAREWALFGLLTSPERKQGYRELAELMRQGTPAEEAVAEAFGMSLAQLTDEFDSRKWRSEVTYRLPPPATRPSVPAATPLDEEQIQLQLEILRSRTDQMPLSTQ
jgi:hypothetical protein